jgi:flagellar hook protein FlgE
MGVTQALYTGVTGLGVNADSMSVIANNIANANSKGFKYDRAEFEDLLSMDLGGDGQIGRGARLSDVRTIHTQGGLAVTDRLTDMAIQGNGFFIVSNPNTEIQESGGQFFTRVGAFNFDKNGYLSDSSGGHLRGYMAEANGKLSTKLSDIRIVTANIPPTATDKLTLNVNLDARAEPMMEDWDIDNPSETSNFNNTVSVFDSHGRSRQVTVYYRRLESSEGVEWEWKAAVPSKDVVDGDEE